MRTSAWPQHDVADGTRRNCCRIRYTIPGADVPLTVTASGVSDGLLTRSGFWYSSAVTVPTASASAAVTFTATCRSNVRDCTRTAAASRRSGARTTTLGSAGEKATVSASSRSVPSPSTRWMVTGAAPSSATTLPPAIASLSMRVAPVSVVSGREQLRREKTGVSGASCRAGTVTAFSHAPTPHRQLPSARAASKAGVATSQRCASWATAQMLWCW